MGTLIYSTICTLDGYYADEHGNHDWGVPDEQVLDAINSDTEKVGTYLYGRRIYQDMIGWETDPVYAEQSVESARFARIWVSARKVVFSRSLIEVRTGNTTLEREFTRDVVDKVKAATDADLTVDGPTLASEALRLGVVDRIDMLVCPVVIGNGLRVFPDAVTLNLELIHEHRFGNGMVQLRYAVRR